MPENADAGKVFKMVSGQWIMGFSGPVAINQIAVWEAIDRYQVDDPTSCFEKVLVLTNWKLNQIHEKTG